MKLIYLYCLTGCLPIICLHNTPATYVKMPTYAAPKEVDGNLHR